MEYLWTPWRSTYMEAKRTPGECIFCVAGQNPLDDRTNLVVHRASYCFALLNRYPYTSGHLMIVPYDHVATLAEASQESTQEMMELVRASETILREVYRPDGLNLGMNVGAAAGAGIAPHIHMHVLPRWFGDANFMTTIGDARLIPEDIGKTYDKLSSAYAKALG